MPYIFSWPAVIKPSRSSDAMSMNIDLLPTLADVLETQPGAGILDGRSLLPIFRGQEETPHDYLYFSTMKLSWEFAHSSGST